MILKILARKDMSFLNLIDYMNREALDNGFTFNCWSSGCNSKEVASEFFKNHAFLKKRKNGNSLYHEILALPNKPELSSYKQTEILKKIVIHYVSLRASEQLVYAQIHTNTDYIHAHLMVSSNRIGSSNRERLSKARLREIQKSLEIYKLENFGEYFPEKVFDKPSSVTTSNREFSYKKRTGRQSRTDVIRELVGQCILESKSIDDFKEKIKLAGYSLYKRGNSYGVKHIKDEKRYRLKALGLRVEIERISRLDEMKKRFHAVEREISEHN